MAVSRERGDDLVNDSKMLRFQPDAFLRVTENLAVFFFSNELSATGRTTLNSLRPFEGEW